jgi:sortase A
MLVELLRTRRWLRLSVSGLSVVLLLGGLGLVAFPFLTNIWQGRIQDQLNEQITTPQLKQAFREGKVETGHSLTRIRIPRLGVDTVVVEGVTPSALRAGAGHYPQTALPCADGNVAIAGHRTTFGRPFGNIDQLREGDTIELTTPIGGCTYKINKDPFVVQPTDVSVIDATPTKALTLTTCHPKGSAAQRLIVTASWIADGKAV